MRIMSNQEIRLALQKAFNAGEDHVGSAIYPYIDGSQAPDFDEWYEANYE